MDSDVMPQYVELDMGVGIMASMTVEQGWHAGLKPGEARYMFAPNVTRADIDTALGGAGG